MGILLLADCGLRVGSVCYKHCSSAGLFRLTGASAAGLGQHVVGSSKSPAELRTRAERGTILHFTRRSHALASTARLAEGQ